MKNIRLGSLALDCADPAALAAFWSALLGGEVAFSSDHFVAVKTERMWLATVKIDDYVPPTWPSGEQPKQMHMDLAVDNLEEAVADALRLGAVQPDFQPSPDRYVVFLDPAGHPFCLTTQIPE
jgi:catechol 2,3-dioxygenase-like lactoylglutathione lyase family enzyme